jgi:hypothetical protein
MYIWECAELLSVGVALSGSLAHPTTNDVTITICLIDGRSDTGESLVCLLFESTRVGFMMANYEQNNLMTMFNKEFLLSFMSSSEGRVVLPWHTRLLFGALNNF